METKRDPLVESIDLLTRWFDRDDTPGWLPIEAILRQSNGASPYKSDTDLAMLRDESRFYAQTHPFALAAIENRVSYVVGSGHTYKVSARPGRELDADAVDKVRREILDFQERNTWFARQQEAMRRFDRDGEVFLRMFDVDGRLIVRFVEPEHVRTPARARGVELGIESDPKDVERVYAYFIGDSRVDADEIQHRKANVDANAARGVPLLYSIRSNLRRSWKLLRNMSTVASVQAAIAIVRKHDSARSGSIQQYVSNQSTAASQDGQGNDKTYQQYPPGAIVDLPAGVSYDFPSQGINIGNYVSALQAELRAIAARVGQPEYMLSGDASNANYASTMVAEGPAVKTFERLQSELIWWDYRIIRRALRLAERAGRLPDGISDLVEIDAEAPVVTSRNRLAEAQADQILITAGLVSRTTVAARHGFDFALERDLMDQENEMDSGASQGGE